MRSTERIANSPGRAEVPPATGFIAAAGLAMAFVRALLFVLLPWTAAAAAPEKYQFGTELKVIDIGYGVLATPMSMLGEVMRRDTVLLDSARKAGFEFRFHPFEKGVDTLTPMLERKLDASMPTDVVALDLIAKGDFMLLGYVRQSFSSVVGARNTTMVDLRGKRVGNASGTSGHNALLQGLAGVGLGEKDVTLVPMAVRDMPDALASGQIDAFAAFEPTPSATLKKFPGRYKALHRQISPAYFVVSRQVTDSQPEAARLMIAALHRAVRWMSASRANLDQASRWTLDSMTRFTGKPVDLGERDIAALTRTDLLEVAGVPLIPPGEIRQGGALWQTFDFFKKAGKLPAELNWQKVEASFDRRLNGEVQAQAKVYRLSKFGYATP